jgi:hypothetical protein
MTRNLDTKTNEQLRADIRESIYKLEQLRAETEAIQSYADELTRRYCVSEETMQVKSIIIDTDAQKDINIDTEGKSIDIDDNTGDESISLDADSKEKLITLDVDMQVNSISFEIDTVVESVDLDSDAKAEAEELFQQMQDIEE